VIVNGRAGDSWKGTVASSTRQALRLREWSYITAAGVETPCDGTVRIPRETVEWIIEVD
jgi:hypothetical protein